MVVGFTFEFNHWIKYGGAHCTCTHLPGLFRGMEWFEIAGLIAPRPLMMLHGELDNTFPISGTRRAGYKTEALFRLLGLADSVRFVELPGLPHAYSRPYRERMYGWMAKHLLGRGTGDAIDEGTVQPLDEQDPRLLCDPARAILSQAPAVVDLARRRGLSAITKLPAPRASLQKWVSELTAAPEPQPHFLAPDRAKPAPTTGGTIEKLSFLSEDGGYIPGLLWLPAYSANPEGL